MKNSKTAVYQALGFPVLIENPSYFEFEGETVLDVNPSKLMTMMFKALPDKPVRLTGAEVRFLRTYMEMTQTAFGESLLVDASSVSKWEKTDQKFTGMDPQTELLLRMRCTLHINGRAHIASGYMDKLAPVLRNNDADYTYHIAV